MKKRLQKLPTPKYAVGDRVFTVDITSEQVRHPCPDCLGTGKWRVLTPAGHEMECACKRCERHLDRDIPSVSFNKFVPVIRERTIGSIRVDTADTYSDDYVSYMCNETGIGSGSIYYESKLFSTREAAQDVGNAIAAEKQSAEDQKPEPLRLKMLSALTLKDAVLEQCHSAIWDSWYSVRGLIGDLNGFLEDEQTNLKDDDREALEEVVRSDKYRSERHPMAQVIAALKQGDAVKALALIPNEAEEAETAESA